VTSTRPVRPVRSTPQSTITTTTTTVTADGTSNQIITVTARDANGNPLTGGSPAGRRRHDHAAFRHATIGPVVNNGNGTYTVTVTLPPPAHSIFAATLGGDAVDGGGASQALIHRQLRSRAGRADRSERRDARRRSPVSRRHRPQRHRHRCTRQPVSGASVTFAVTAGGAGIAAVHRHHDASASHGRRLDAGHDRGANT